MVLKGTPSVVLAPAWGPPAPMPSSRRGAGPHFKTARRRRACPARLFRPGAMVLAAAPRAWLLLAACLAPLQRARGLSMSMPPSAGSIRALDAKALRKGGVAVPRTVMGPGKKRSRDRESAEEALELLASRYLRVDPGGFAKNALELQCLDPPVLTVRDFLPAEACDALVASVGGAAGEDVHEVPSKTLSEATAGHRTSTSWFLHFRRALPLVERVRALLPGVRSEQMEEPQVVRYRMGEKFGYHCDALPPSMLEDGDGGQRVATLLVYLNDVDAGGATVFRSLGPDGAPLRVKPRKGTALLFFPADCDGEGDDRTEHQAEVAMDEKWIAQLWIHEADYAPQLPQGNDNRGL